ncbi:short-chain dehydrogenase [Pleurotus eryngii]|uniref:Short-chain dehydrogenase n=1 Tax=Pleurotus eryngii TaxID=5323 RepID=A0A9P5ZNW3_PLEER|nr:short-chain dehydrogenase [Pleurotus eryngii]
MVHVSFWDFVKGQWTAAPAVERADLTGKTVVVVGANTGIGYEAAKHFASMNPGRLIMACRSQERGNAAVTNLKKSTGFDRAELWLVDLCSFASVKAFADKFEKEVERIDILVANAAIIPHAYEVTKDGWETSLQVNHLAPALLIFLLLPQILKTAEMSTSIPRVVIVGSEVHQQGEISQKIFEAPSANEALSSREFCIPYSPRSKYHLSKLLNILFTQALANHLPPTHPTIIANCINPGFCRSELTRGMWNPVFLLFRWLLARPAEEGARQLIWGSVGMPDESQGGAESLKGAYVHFSKVMEPSDFVISEKGQEFKGILWSDTVKILSKVDPRVQSIVERYLRK